MLADLVLSMWVCKTIPETGETLWINLATRRTQVRASRLWWEACMLNHLVCVLGLLVRAGQAASADGLYDYWRQDRTARDARLELCQDTARYSVLCRHMHTGGPAPSQPEQRNHP